MGHLQATASERISLRMATCARIMHESRATGSTVQSPLAVLLCRLASRRTEVLESTAVLSASSGPYTNIWEDEGEGNKDVS